MAGDAGAVTQDSNILRVEACPSNDSGGGMAGAVTQDGSMLCSPYDGASARALAEEAPDVWHARCEAATLACSTQQAQFAKVRIDCKLARLPLLITSLVVT